MAYHTTPTADQVADWEAWVAERPAPVREVIATHGFLPWKLYLLKTSGHRVVIHSFDEPIDNSPVTLKVHVLHDFNTHLAFERTVFGIHPEDLEECDLPERPN